MNPKSPNRCAVLLFTNKQTVQFQRNKHNDSVSKPAAGDQNKISQQIEEPKRHATVGFETFARSLSRRYLLVCSFISTKTYTFQTKLLFR